MGATGKTPANGATGENNEGGATQHSAPRASFEFRLGKDTTSDFAAVQRHIDAQAEQLVAQETELNSLREFQSAALTKERTDYVEGLKNRNLITGPQAEKFSKLALEMTPESFEVFKSAYADAEPHSMLENYGATSNVAPGASADTPGSQAFQAHREQMDDGEAILREQVKVHARAGRVTHEEIAKYSCFTKLKAIHPDITIDQILQGK